MDLYFERYPGVLRYMENTRLQASEQGYVETLEGRRLYLADIKSVMECAVKRRSTPQCRNRSGHH